MSEQRENEPEYSEDTTRHFSRGSKVNWGMRDMPRDPPVVLRRLADQINFFNKRSQQNQTKYKLFKGAVYFAAAAVTLSPVLDQYNYGYTTMTVAILGASIIFLQNLLGMNNCRGNWISYRRICEDLKTEKYLYLSRASLYEGIHKPDTLLAGRVEILLAEGRNEWLALRAGEEHDMDGGTSSLHKKEIDPNE